MPWIPGAPHLPADLMPHWHAMPVASKADPAGGAASCRPGIGTLQVLWQLNTQRPAPNAQRPASYKQCQALCHRCLVWPAGTQSAA